MSQASVEAQRRTQAFARVIGPYVAVFTTVYAIRLPSLTGLIADLFASQTLVLMLGAMMLAAGLVIIGTHRNWRGPVAITVSLFGWFVAVRGFGLIAIPTAVRSGVDAATLSPTGLAAARVFFALLAVIGLLLTYAGWFGKPATTRRESPTAQS